MAKTNSAEGLGARAEPGPGDIAIIGMACVFPGAADVDAYWQNIVSKVDATSDAPQDAWDKDVFYDPDATTNDRVYCKRGGYINPLAWFDPLANGVMPKAVEGGEPDQWLALQCARAAFLDAGYTDEIPERARTAVILGRGTHLNRGNLTILQHGAIIDQTLGILKTLHPEFTEADLERIRQDLKKDLPPFNADTAHGLIPNVIAGRIANRLDLMGPNFTVDAACASSLLAVETAVRGLRGGEYDLALVGGVHVATPGPVLTLFCQLGALSRREQIRPFDKSADGTLLSAGLGMLILKRRADAERDGRRIYALIKGVGLASDGRGMSVMAPRLEGEILALERAYESAGISPRTIGLIEAHGTGTPVGDATEIAALTRVFGPRPESGPWCGMGSVKSMIGHAMPAAGMAGLIKATLALHHRVLPPTINVEEPNPELELEKTPFYLNTETRPWIHRTPETPRRAGVNSFGFGGINAHAILEEYTVPEHAAVHTQPLRFDSEVFVIAAASRAELVARVAKVRALLDADPAVDPKDLAYSLNVPTPEGAFRLGVVASGVADLRQKLERAGERLADPACVKIKETQGLYFFAEPFKPASRLAFLFPGEGSQYVNMLADLCIRFPEVRQCFDLIDSVFADHSRNYVPSDIIFPRPSFSAAERAADEKRLWQMEGAFEAVLTASWALFTVLSRLEIRPDVLAGHSTGEYAAMRVAGMIDAPDEERLARFATELNQCHYQHLAAGGEIPRATLVAVGADSGTVSALAAVGPRPLYVAMDNCPHQTVVVGTEDQADRLIEELRRRGLLYERLAFDRPYHTPLFEPYSEGLKTFFSRWVVAPPRLPLYSCTTHSPFPSELGEIHQLAVRHWMAPVEFQKTVEAMYADGVRIFVEVGPRGNLSAFVEDILRGRPHLAVASDTMNRPGLTQMNHLVGLLAAQGVPMRLDYLYERRQPKKLALDSAAAAAAEPGRAKRGKPMKLEVGWIPLVLSDETATDLRKRMPAGEAARTEAPSPQPGPSVPVAAPATPSPAPPVPAAPRPAAPRAAAPAAGADRLMASYWQTMDQFLATQEDVMQAYLGGRAIAPATSAQPLPPPPPVPVAEPPRAAAPAPAVAAPAPAPPPRAPAPAAAKPDEKSNGGGSPFDGDASSVSDLLLKIVSDRTGYPVEMIDLDLDLEADLGIDSIKRVEILGSFQQRTGLMQENDMEALAGRKTLRQVAEFLAGRAGGSGAASTAPPAPAASPAPLRPPGSAPAGPFIGSVVTLEPGRRLVARREIRRDEDLYLRDHLGHQVSVADPELTSLAIMPVTMSMEMMGEAATALVPGHRLIGMREVRAHRWLTLEGDTLTLKLVATADPAKGGREVSVQIFEADSAEGSSSGSPFVEGTMILGDAYPDPPPAGPLSLKGERPSKWAPENLYRDVMFHGPAFQGVTSMDRWGEDGAEATLQVLAPAGLFASSRTPALVTDPILLDQPGQVVGFWIAEHLERAYVIFPFRLESLHLYGPSPAAGTRLKCAARIALVGDQQMRSDLDVLTADGRLLARLVGWWDQRFDVPRALIHFLQDPGHVVLGEPWPAPVASLPGAGFRAHRFSLKSLPEGFFTAHGGVWQRPLAHLILSRKERELWRGLKTPEPRRLEWLLGRLVAKTALRLHLEERHGLHLPPADIEILPDPEGRPIVGGAWSRDVPRVPVLSVSHADGEVVAVVGEADSALGVGVDVEHAGPMREGAERLAFSSAEQALLASLAESPQESWALRLWCAKEAVAKALGLGLVGGPRGLVVEQLDPASGSVQLRLSGEMAERLPTVDGRTLVAHTARERDLVVATSVYTRE